MFKKLMRTDDSLTGLVARLALGVVILPHGLQKLLGMFGGGGISGTVDFFGSIGVPAIIAYLIIIGESFGSASLILGFLTRFCAGAITVIMLGAVFIVYAAKGISIPDLEFEFHILAIGLGIISLIVGGGAASIDRALSKEKIPAV